jgi:hypothetical protein
MELSRCLAFTALVDKFGSKCAAVTQRICKILTNPSSRIIVFSQWDWVCFIVFSKVTFAIIISSTDPHNITKQTNTLICFTAKKKRIFDSFGVYLKCDSLQTSAE